MRNKLVMLIILVMSFIIVKSEVYAAATSATFNQEPIYSELKGKYESSLTKTSISSSGFVTLYGKSVCNGSSCEHNYHNGESNFKNILSQSVTCTNGESYITYGDKPSSGKADFKDNDGNIINGDAYWSEDYYVTCTSDSTGGNTVLVDNSNTNTNTNNNSGNTSDTGNSGSTSDTGNSDYGSSSTTDTSPTGVTTYFITLSLVAMLSYVCMILIKKYNVIKKI